jgi:hypothetical protein
VTFVLQPKQNLNNKTTTKNTGKNPKNSTKKTAEEVEDNKKHRKIYQNNQKNA